MSENKKGFPYNMAAIVCGLWFTLTGWLWTYYICLVIAYPVGLAGLFFWYKAHKNNQRDTMHNIAAGSLLLGLIISIASIFLYR